MAINKIIEDGGKPQEDPIEAAKRKIYLIGTPAGILSLLVVWAIGLRQHNMPVADFFILPLLAILFLIFFILLWRNSIPLRTFELSVYALLMAFALFAFVSIIIDILHTNGSFSPNFAIWLPFVYILSFLVLRTGRAVLVSILFFLITLILGVAACLYLLQKGQLFPNITLLVQVYFASAFYIAVLYLIAQIKERYISEHAAVGDMAKLAMTNSLTQVDNRRLLTQLLREEVTRAERHNLPLSVLLFDLDRFKGSMTISGITPGMKSCKELPKNCGRDCAHPIRSDAGEGMSSCAWPQILA